MPRANKVDLSDIPAVLVLAGGQGTRLLGIGKVIPKFMLPIYDKPLIEHTLDYFLQCRYQGVIIISTRAAQTELLENFKSNYEALNIVIVSNPAHSLSAVDALQNVGSLVSIPSPFMLLLGDIYFPENPFSKIMCALDGDVLLGSKADKELDLGGIVTYDGAFKVKQVVKKPSKLTGHGMRWSGTVVCGENFWEDINALAAATDLSKLSLEDVFSYRHELHNSSYVQDDIDFININTPDHFVLANLIAQLQTHDGEPLRRYIKDLRRAIISSGKQI